MSQLRRWRIRPSGFLDDDFAARLEKLTPREWEVLECLLAGATDKEIALASGTSPSTVGNQRRSIIDKLEIESEIELFQQFLSAWLGSELPSPSLLCEAFREGKRQA